MDLSSTIASSIVPDYRRLIPGSLSNPFWVSRQSTNQKLSILKQYDTFRKLPKKLFMEITKGKSETNYETRIYHIGEVQSHSFFIVYSFAINNGLTIKELSEFIMNRLSPSYGIMSLEKTKTNLIYYVMVLFNNPCGIKFSNLQHPKKPKVHVEVTWSIAHLEKYILNKGISGFQQFGEGSIDQYSSLYDIKTQQQEMQEISHISDISDVSEIFSQSFTILNEPEINPEINQEIFNLKELQDRILELEAENKIQKEENAELRQKLKAKQ